MECNEAAVLGEPSARESLRGGALRAGTEPGVGAVLKPGIGPVLWAMGCC